MLVHVACSFFMTGLGAMWQPRPSVEMWFGLWRAVLITVL